MTPGVSSTSLASLGRDALCDWARRRGARCVDLRWGREHGWQRSGLASWPADLPVAFLGLSSVLGSHAAHRAADGAGLEMARRAGVPVRCFVDARVAVDPVARALALRQCERLSEGLAGLLLETHAGHAGLDALTWLCRHGGARLLVDTLGLWRLGQAIATLPEDARPLVGAVQVKGFHPRPPWRHEPLRHSGLVTEETAQLVSSLPAGLAVTVETRAGTESDDLAWLLEHEEKR